MDNAHDRDEGGGGEDDAEQRQETAKFRGAQRLQRNRGRSMYEAPDLIVPKEMDESSGAIVPVRRKES